MSEGPASGEGRARLKKDMPTSEREGPTTRKVVAFADETTSALTVVAPAAAGISAM